VIDTAGIAKKLAMKKKYRGLILLRVVA